MRTVLVCGGRNYDKIMVFFRFMDMQHQMLPIARILEGGARGADRLARLWAKSRCVPYTTFDADWALLGKPAGPLRNARMLEEGKPDYVIAFPGADGTADMVRRAREAGVTVIEAP